MMTEHLVNKIFITRLSCGLVSAEFDLPQDHSTVLADRKERIDPQYKDSNLIKLPELRTTVLSYNPKSGKLLLTDNHTSWQVLTNLWVNFRKFDNRISFYPFYREDEVSTITFASRKDELDLHFRFN